MPPAQTGANVVSLLLTGRRGTDNQISKMMLHEYRARSYSSLCASVVGMIILASVLWILNPQLRILIWVLCMAMLVPCEYVFGLRTANVSQNTASAQVRDIFFMMGFAITRGLGWGIGGMLFFEEQLEYQMFLSLTLCCVAVFGATQLSTILWAAIAFSASVMFPTIAMLIQSKIAFFHVLGLAGIGFFGITLWFAVVSSRTGFNGFMLSHQNLQLVASLQETNKALAEKNEILNYALAKIEEVAITDELTGCYNRRYMMDMLKHELANSLREYRPFTLLLIDVDHFKKVNDTYGHLVGDRVLAGIAQTLQMTIRNSDTLARFGGEEFACMLPSTTVEEAAALADRIRHTVSLQPITFSAGRLQVTVSIGVAQWHPNEPIESVIHCADLALYGAKAKGRNCVVAETNSPSNLAPPAHL